MAAVAVVHLEDYTEAQLVAECEAVLTACHYEAVLALLQSKDTKSTLPLVIDHHQVIAHKQDLGALVLFFPNKLLPMFKRALLNVQRAILTLIKDEELSVDDFSLKENVQPRFHSVPSNPPFTLSSVPRASDVGRLIAFKGTVIRTGQPKELEATRFYRCTKCQSDFEVAASLTSMDPFPLPTQCESGLIPPCPNRKFTYLENMPKTFRDFQEIKVQEHMHVLGIGTVPRSIVGVLLDDLVDSVKPGDDVTLTGQVLRKWHPLFHNEKCEVELLLHVNHVTVNNENKFGTRVPEELRQEFEEFWDEYKHAPLLGRAQIVSSICPDLYGMHVVKLALALVLAGGVQRLDENGTRVRGESHLLMVGDPGLGKSQLLKYAAKLSTRSVLTTGIGSTTAGLTVTVVKEKGGDYTMEAGALVLADGGICCIDEFNSMRKEDRAAIHEAMEQQTLSVAKGGMVTKLQSRCSVIAAVNPKGRYDPDDDITANINIASPLLSRFDLVMLMLDQTDATWDTMVSDFLLKTQRGRRRGENQWSLEKLQSYLCHIRAQFRPSMSTEAEKVIIEYYKKQRSFDQRNSARTTIRLLESLIRLAQSHAKIMFRNTVTLQDAVMAVILMESSLVSSAILGTRSTVRSVPAENPDLEYRKQESVILRVLRLEHLQPDYPEEPPVDPLWNPGEENKSQQSGLRGAKEDAMDVDEGHSFYSLEHHNNEAVNQLNSFLASPSPPSSASQNFTSPSSLSSSVARTPVRGRLLGGRIPATQSVNESQPLIPTQHVPSLTPAQVSEAGANASISAEERPVPSPAMTSGSSLKSLRELLVEKPAPPTEAFQPPVASKFFVATAKPSVPPASTPVGVEMEDNVDYSILDDLDEPTPKKARKQESEKAQQVQQQTKKHMAEVPNEHDELERELSRFF